MQAASSHDDLVLGNGGRHLGPEITSNEYTNFKKWSFAKKLT